MKIAISSTGKTLESEIDPKFGRCAYFLIIDVDNKKIMLISENNGHLQAMTYPQAPNSKWIKFDPDDWFYMIKYGRQTIKTELYYGNGFNSSSTRKVQFPPDVEEITVYKYDGEKRRVPLKH